MIEVENLSKIYGSSLEPALDGVSFRVERGEAVGFLGPNGAGKTTTMRILAGLMAPTSGTARVDNFDIGEDSRAVRRRIGYLPENAPLYLDMTVRDYLMYVASLRGVPMKKRPERLEAALDAGKLEDRVDMLIAKLSKGYRQRVGLAQAIVHDPDVVILDEPSAGLDPRQRVETRRVIAELAREHTVLLSTHILPDVQETCGRVLIINRGRLVAEDKTAHLAHSDEYALRVQLRRAPDGVAAKLRGIKGVREAEYEVSGAWNVRASRDVREEVAALCVRENWGLLELSTARRSLEDAFLALTTAEEK